MARRNRTLKENARRENIRELPQIRAIGSISDIQDLFKEAIAQFMENGLETELDDELGYSKCDYKNKDTDNSRNGHGNKAPVPEIIYATGEQSRSAVLHAAAYIHG